MDALSSEISFSISAVDGLTPDFVDGCSHQHQVCIGPSDCDVGAQGLSVGLQKSIHFDRTIRNTCDISGATGKRKRLEGPGAVDNL